MMAALAVNTPEATSIPSAAADRPPPALSFVTFLMVLGRRPGSDGSHRIGRVEPVTETLRDQRRYDVVVLWATGYTGRLSAECLARHAPDGCRWALAARNRGRLEEVRTHLAATDPGLAELPLLLADSADGDSLADLARSTRVVISTVGPYLLYGGPLVATCADAGTDYVDLTGEPEFVDNMYLEHHDRAVATGARIVHACGFDSVPHDLGARFTVLQLPEGQAVTLRGVVRAGAQFSGGTFHSVMTAFSRARQM